MSVSGWRDTFLNRLNCCCHRGADAHCCEMEQVSDDLEEGCWAESEAGMQGDRCSSLIQGFKDGRSNDGEEWLEKQLGGKNKPGCEPWALLIGRENEWVLIREDKQEGVYVAADIVCTRWGGEIENTTSSAVCELVSLICSPGESLFLQSKPCRKDS